MQVFRYNWNQFTQKVETKEQFVLRLKTQCSDIHNEQREQLSGKVRFFKEMDESDQGYVMLKKLCMFMIQTLAQILLVDMLNNSYASNQFHSHILTVFEDHALP